MPYIHITLYALYLTIYVVYDLLYATLLLKLLIVERYFLLCVKGPHPIPLNDIRLSFRCHVISSYLWVKYSDAILWGSNSVGEVSAALAVFGLPGFWEPFAIRGRVQDLYIGSTSPTWYMTWSITLQAKNLELHPTRYIISILVS